MLWVLSSTLESSQSHTVVCVLSRQRISETQLWMFLQNLGWKLDKKEELSNILGCSAHFKRWVAMLHVSPSLESSHLRTWALTMFGLFPWCWLMQSSEFQNMFFSDSQSRDWTKRQTYQFCFSEVAADYCRKVLVSRTVGWLLAFGSSEYFWGGLLLDYSLHLKASSKLNLICGRVHRSAPVNWLGNTPALRVILEATPHQAYK